MDSLISRQAAIDALDVLCQEHRYKIPGQLETYSEYNEAWQDALDRAEGAIFNLPSAQPEPDEWCTDCKEYDHDRHCCPRWNRVIRETLKDAQAEQRWIPVSEKAHPTKEGKYLVTDDAGGMATVDVDDFMYCDDGSGMWLCSQNVTAWMPRPEPYREEGEADVLR